MQDEPSWDSVSLDMANGYNNGAGSSGGMCRICREGNQRAKLVSPCSCSGTMGFVHKSCLEQWLNQRNVDSCEFCGERFQMATEPITTLPLLRWVWRNKKWLWRPLRYDLLGLVAATLFAMLVCALLALLAVYWKGVPWVIGFFYLVAIVFLVLIVAITLNNVRARYRFFLA
ncbi:hypothetical protein MTO96_006731 [Rhipicephalus appendiculatus]